MWKKNIKIKILLINILYAWNSFAEIVRGNELLKKRLVALTDWYVYISLNKSFRSYEREKKNGGHLFQKRKYDKPRL